MVIIDRKRRKAYKKGVPTKRLHLKEDSEENLLYGEVSED